MKEIHVDVRFRVPEISVPKLFKNNPHFLMQALTPLGVMGAAELFSKLFLENQQSGCSSAAGLILGGVALFASSLGAIGADVSQKGYENKGQQAITNLGRVILPALVIGATGALTHGNDVALIFGTEVYMGMTALAEHARRKSISR